MGHRIKKNCEVGPHCHSSMQNEIKSSRDALRDNFSLQPKLAGKEHLFHKYKKYKKLSFTREVGNSQNLRTLWTESRRIPLIFFANVDSSTMFLASAQFWNRMEAPNEDLQIENGKHLNPKVPCCVIAIIQGRTESTWTRVILDKDHKCYMLWENFFFFF